MRFLRRRRKPPEVPSVDPVDHSLADTAIKNAVQAHTAAQAQATHAREVVSELRQVNIRNGFAPAIRRSFGQSLGDAI